MFLATLVIICCLFMFGGLLATPTTFFGAPNTPQDRLIGSTALILAVVIFIVSFSTFRSRFEKPLIFMLSLVTGYSLLLHFINKLNYEALMIVIIYLTTMGVFFGIAFLVKDEMSMVETSLTIAKSKRQNKKLTILPLGIITTFILYFTVLSPWISRIKQERYYQKVISNFNYQLYTPKQLPQGYRLIRNSVGTKSNYWYSEYQNQTGNRFSISQFNLPSLVSLKPPHCSISHLPGEVFEVQYSSSHANYISSPCLEVLTPQRLPVYLMENTLFSISRNFAVTIKENTLITIDGYEFTEAEMLNLFDSLVLKRY
jgi:hypothetical protein